MSIHLVNEDFETISCESAWEQERECHEAGNQTSHIEFENCGNQTVSVSDVAVQAQDDYQKSPPNVDFEKLASWLNRITPQVLKELDNVSKSRAFHGYKLQEGSQETQTKLLYTLEQALHKPQGLVSSIAWSATGGVVAVSFCAPKHASWCDHSGHVFLYHVNRQDFKPSVPSRKLELNACVTVMAAHPSEPYILACGTSSGEVVVWNLQREDPVILGSSSLQSEPISHMEWVRGRDASQVKPFLVTFSQDGSIFVWNVKFGTSSLKLVNSFLLQSEKTHTDLGISCASFHPESSYQFLAGVDGGSILICSIESRRPLSRSREMKDIESLDFFDPILETIDGHKGAVTGVLWVPYDGDKFLSCGTDSELHIYSLSQMSILRVVHLAEPCLGMAACFPRPRLIALWGSLGFVYLLDILRDKVVLSLKSYTSQPVPLSAVCYQGSSSFVMAAGNLAGQVHVWQVPLDKLLEEGL